MTIEETIKLKEIVADILEVDPLEISNDYNLVDSGIDSISFIKLIILIENSFLIEFADEDLSVFNLSTLDEIMKYIDQNRKLVETIR